MDEFKKLCVGGAIKWTTHIMIRLQERNINPSDVKSCIMTGRIIEEYKDDYPYPSCLILGASVNGEYLHSVMGIGNNFLWLITAYYPDKDEWNETLDCRREMK